MLMTEPYDGAFSDTPPDPLATKTWRHLNDGQTTLGDLASCVANWVDAARRFSATLGDRMYISVRIQELGNPSDPGSISFEPSDGDSGLAALLRREEALQALCHASSTSPDGLLVTARAFASS